MHSRALLYITISIASIASLYQQPLQVAWPPVESEEKEQQQVEIIQTHLPVKHHQRILHLKYLRTIY